VFIRVIHASIAVFRIINSVGVRGVDLAAIYLTILLSPGWGLVVMYLPLVNSVVHVG
jgi:hypothetical protein